MKVLLYTTAFPPKIDGVSLRVSKLVTDLRRFGHQVLILCPYENSPDEYLGAKIIKLPSFSPLDYSETKLSYPFPLFTLFKIFWTFQPDVLHMVGPEFVTIPMMLIAKMFNVPVIGSYHFYVDAWIKSQHPIVRPFLHWISWMELAYNYNEYVICPSKPMQEIMHLKGMKCNDVWPPAVDSQTFNPKYFDVETRRKLTFGHPDAPLVVYIGRVSHEKSMHLLPKILQFNKKVYLAVIGNGPIAHIWKAKHGEHNRIYCTGTHVKGEELSKIYASADVFVLPSSFETLGNVILEAMASGVAVVGCNAGGVTHMVKDRQNGLLFEPEDGDTMAALVDELLTNAELRKTLARNGLDYARQISWERASEYVIEIYRRVIEMKASGKVATMKGKNPTEREKTHRLNLFLQVVFTFLLFTFITLVVLQLQ